MAKRAAKSLSNPVLLKPMDKKESRILQVIIETPKGSRNKFAFDSKQKIFSGEEGPSRRDELPVRLWIPSSHAGT